MSVAGLEQVALDQVRDDFGVRLGGELVAFFDELLFQRKVVLHDAIVDDDDFAGAVAMRMGVFFRGASVSGPAGVADAVGAVERFEANGFFEIAKLAFGAANFKAVAVAGHSDTGRVIAAILQPAQAIDDDGHDALFANVSDDTAHTNALLVRWGKPRVPQQRPQMAASAEGFVIFLPANPALTRCPDAFRPCAPQTPAPAALDFQSSSAKRNSSMTGLVRTSRAMRSTSACASARVNPPLSVISKYLPWRTSCKPW